MAMKAATHPSHRDRLAVELADLARQLESMAKVVVPAATASKMREAAGSIRWQLNWIDKHPDAHLFFCPFCPED